MSQSFSRDDLIEKIRQSGKNSMVSQEAAIAIVNSMLNIESDNLVPPQEGSHEFQALVINPKDGDEQKKLLNLSENFKINLRPQDAKGNYQAGFNLYGDTQSYLFITEAEGTIGINNVYSPKALLHIGTDDAGGLHKFYIGTEKQASFLIDKNNNVAIHGSLTLGENSEDSAEINVFSKDVALGREKTSDNKVPTQKAVKIYIDEATKQCTNAIDKIPAKIDAKCEEVKKSYIEDINKIPTKIDEKCVTLKNEIYKEKFGDITKLNGLEITKAANFKGVIEINGMCISGVDGKKQLGFYKDNMSVSQKPLMLLDDAGNLTIKGDLIVESNLQVKKNVKVEENFWVLEIAQLEDTAKLPNSWHHSGQWQKPKKNEGEWNFSDVQFKKNIQPIKDTLSKLSSIQAVSYQWNEAYAALNHVKLEEISEQQIGVIAQDIEKIFPELVRDQDGYKAVNYQGLIPVLLSAIKEQQSMIEKLQQQQNVVEVLKQQIIEIQQKLGNK